MIRRWLGRLDYTQAWAWVGLLLGAALVVLVWVSTPRPIPRAILIDRLTVTGPAGQATGAKNVPLPHVWDREAPAWNGQARYEMDWPENLHADFAGKAPLAIYFQRIGARFRVTLNGTLLAEVEWDTGGYVDTGVVPHVVDIPAGLLRPDARNNHLVIDVRGRPLQKSGLSAFYLGPRDALKSRHALVYWWQVHLTWMLVACALVLALLSGLVWQESRERAYCFLAAASMAWAIRLGLSPLVSVALPFELRFYVHKLAFTLYCGFLFLFLWDLFDHRQNRLRLLGSSLLWLGPVWLAFTTFSNVYLLYSVWSGWLAVVASVALALMIQRARAGLDGNQRLLLLAGLVTVVCGVRDFGVVSLGWPGVADLRWMPLGGLVFMLTLLAVLVQRLSSYVSQINLLSQTLELRVLDKERELRAAFERLREVENKQVLDEERKRLTRDMHDGLGSHLVQTLNLARASGPLVPEAVIAMLVHALDELRMTLDSMEPMDGDLPAILGTLRRRIGPALEAAGIELDWQVQEVPAIGGLAAGGTMHLFRFLQEVFANIIRHAQARQVSVRTWVDGGRVMLSVADDGRGLGEGFRAGGQGVYNIRLRAAAVGASVQFIDNQPGTRVEFRFSDSEDRA